MLFLFFVASFDLLADTNATIQQKESYIDKNYNIFSKNVVDLSENIDIKLSQFLKSSDTSQHEQSIDTFYINKKFSDETDETYLSVRLESFFQSKEPSQYNAVVNAQMPLVRTNKDFNFFVKNMNQEITNTFEQKESESTQYTPMLGVNYFAPAYYNIKSKYLIATHGLNPLVQVRYYIEFQSGEWNIEPTQTFKYSRNDKFEEESNIYFDNKITDLTLFRITLHRKTTETINGMDYALSFQYYYSPKKNTGLSLSQAFLGNTEYQYSNCSSSVDQKTETYSGINNYATSIGWRENIWKEWFFYQISPGVNFHKQYNYETNYTLIFLVDIYFGTLNQ